MKKRIIHFALLGWAFLLVEYFFRCVSYDTNTFHPALLLMFFVGGLSALLIGQLNESSWVNRNINIFWQSIIGMVIILCVEFVSGVILNLWLGLGIWSYANYPGNLLGQICPQFAAIWFLMCPFGFWLDDVIRYYVEGGIVAPYSLIEIYLKMFNPFSRPFVD
jgi:uncharacterized membrane protein